MSVFNVDTDPTNKMCNELKDKAIKLFSQKEDDRGITYRDKVNIWYNTDIRWPIDKAFKAYQSARDKDKHKQRKHYIETKRQKYIQDQTTSKEKPKTNPNTPTSETKMKNDAGEGTAERKVDKNEDRNASGDNSDHNGSSDDNSDDSSESSSDTDSSSDDASSSDDSSSNTEIENGRDNSENAENNINDDNKQDAKQPEENKQSSNVENKSIETIEKKSNQHKAKRTGWRAILPEKVNDGIDWLWNNMPSDKYFAKGYKYVSDGEREIVFLDKWLNIYAEYEKQYRWKQHSVSIVFHQLRAEHLRQIEREKNKRHQDNNQQIRMAFEKWLSESNQGKQLKFTINSASINYSYNKSPSYSISFKKDVVLENCRNLKFGICESNISSNKKTILFKQLPNMDFELRNNEKLLYHQILKSQSVLFIVCSSKQIKTSKYGTKKKTVHVTRAVVGRNGVLRTNTKAVHEWERMLDLASYAETQQILALYDKSKQTIAFYSASNEKGDISRFMLDKNEINLNDESWAVADAGKCSVYSILHMIMDDATKRLIIIDSNFCLRIYDLNKGNWYANEDDTTALDLGVNYNQCLITSEGAFLLAFKPGDIVNAENDDTDTRTTMTVVNLDDFKILRIDQPLPSQFKPENMGNFYLKKVTCAGDCKEGDEEATALVTINGDPDKPHRSCLFVQLLDISVSSKKIHFHIQSKSKDRDESKRSRRVSKLDYFQYMLDKFGSKPVFFHGTSDDFLELNTCFLLDSKSVSTDEIICKTDISQCKRVPDRACGLVFDQCKKDFKLLQWNSDVVILDWYDNQSLSFGSIVKHDGLSFDSFVKNIIIQFPMQIARTSNGQFIIMHNGEDNQSAYRKGCNDAYQWRNRISFGAYDAIISDWKGPIRVVSSMGKQSTGKSYALNHLFGSKFDTSGARCTDGAWMTVRICKGIDFDEREKKERKKEKEEEDIMYIILDFEGLGTFERTDQEDTMLAVFNASISNCTIFRCENSLGPELERMFRRFQNGVNQFQGDPTLFQGFLLMVIKDVPPGDKVTVKKEFISKLKQFVKRSEAATTNKKDVNSFLTHMVIVEIFNSVSLFSYSFSCLL